MKLFIFFNKTNKFFNLVHPPFCRFTEYFSKKTHNTLYTKQQIPTFSKYISSFSERRLFGLKASCETFFYSILVDSKPFQFSIAINKISFFITS